MRRWINKLSNPLQNPVSGINFWDERLGKHFKNLSYEYKTNGACNH